MRWFGSLAVRVLLLVLAVCAIAGPAFHHHDSTGPEAHCAVCHFVAGLVLFAGCVVTLWVLPPLLAWALPDSPFCKHASLHFAACGLRAPPVSL